MSPLSDKSRMLLVMRKGVSKKLNERMLSYDEPAAIKWPNRAGENTRFQCAVRARLPQRKSAKASSAVSPVSAKSNRRSSWPQYVLTEKVSSPHRWLTLPLKS